MNQNTARITQSDDGRNFAGFEVASSKNRKLFLLQQMFKIFADKKIDSTPNFANVSPNYGIIHPPEKDLPVEISVLTDTK
ncbi:hypothetical protein IQ266_12660 [filamentous cyanobacterium LEGE 11480]|uniref:Uncharacterized protein n=1 Tax=Romeriopsis navalis LEGE 11480 TaxID=2777977 RepID=A0A928VMY6_9CYAN|nr:hypothetical protein [Romeriopsis navalis]MBE9030582.1 hypothetical protein [Romeriopsis navalis LEGE 11480]